MGKKKLNKNILDDNVLFKKIVLGAEDIKKGKVKLWKKIDS